MTDKEGFGFDETSEPAEGEEVPATARKGSPRRLALLVLLLLALAGAGIYFYLGSPPVSEPPSPPRPVRQPIAVPAPPAQPEQPAAPTARPEPTPAGQESKAEVTAGTGQVPPPATAPQPSPPAAESVPAGGPYVLEAGAFLLKSNLLEAEKKVRGLGFEPRVRTVRREMPMTRLRVGVFPPAEAKARLKELAPVAPDAFLLKRGDEVAVYAASYAGIDRARRFADHLYQEGIRVEEEPVQAKVPLLLLSFGDFADREAALKAADRARGTGLEVFLVKRP